MHPWLLQYPPISMYGVCIVLGLLCAWAWARTNARQAGVDPSRIDLLMPMLVGTGLAGAWLFGRWTDAATGEDTHGAVLVGSLLMATAAGCGYGVLSRIPLGVLGDLCAAPLALGIGIGRVGCFFAGCCFGKVCGPAWSAWGVRFPPGSFAALEQIRRGQLTNAGAQSLPVFPVQLYESMGCVLLAVAVGWLGARRGLRWISGEGFLAVGAGYAMGRFVLEFLRADNPPVATVGAMGGMGGVNLTFSQCAAAGMMVLLAITWWMRRRHAEMWNLRSGASSIDSVI